MDRLKIKQLKKHGGNTGLLAKELGLDGRDLIDFSSNINPYGPPDSVIQTVKQAIDNMDKYPEQEAESLVKEIADHLKINGKNIVAGNGTIELIYLLPQVLNTKKSLLLVPSFTEYELSLHKTGSRITYKRVFNGETAKKAVKEVSKNIDTVFVGNPNNPCGYVIEKDVLLAAIDCNVERLWIIDEAFIDFTDDGSKNSLIKEAPARDNLIVLRSLTKVYSIAGLRLGYAVASMRTAEKIREAKYPWSINSVAIAAGIAALKDESFIDKSIAAISKETKRFFRELSNIDGLYLFKPSANYILVRIKKKLSAIEIQKELLYRGFVIRDCSTYTGMDDKYFRVAVKKPEDNDRLIGALREVLVVKQ